MKTEKPIKLRGHHLRGLASLVLGDKLYGEYEKKILPDLRELWKFDKYYKDCKNFFNDLLKMNKNQAIVLTDWHTPDGLCKICTVQDEHCFVDLDKTDLGPYYPRCETITDKDVTDSLNLKIGEIYTLGDIIKIIYKNKSIFKSWIHKNKELTF